MAGGGWGFVYGDWDKTWRIWSQSAKRMNDTECADDFSSVLSSKRSQRSQNPPPTSPLTRRIWASLIYLLKQTWTFCFVKDYKGGSWCVCAYVCVRVCQVPLERH